MASGVSGRPIPRVADVRVTYPSIWADLIADLGPYPSVGELTVWLCREVDTVRRDNDQLRAEARAKEA